MLTTDLRNGYERLFASCNTVAPHEAAVGAFNKLVLSGADRYKIVEAATKVPWYVIALIHGMEADFAFNCHLHNGDPLSARTIHVPRGRPAEGEPPFKWETSAADALSYDSFLSWSDWSIAGICYKLEGYNGWGYRAHHINSPYLWSFSNNYERGKYTSDGHWDQDAVSQQVGAITALKELIDGEMIALEAEEAPQT